MKIELSSEQKEFIRLAKTGCNILVDACIGSGKTTAIQCLCNELDPDLKILYLTYNKLLKVDAKSKIKNKNVTVTNYHGFAYRSLLLKGEKAGVSDLIQTFNRRKPKIDSYDVLIIDEYQDIDGELADLLWYIKSVNPKMQVLAVGDMCQKIYDKTTLDVGDFIGSFLSNYKKLDFTKCFRLSTELANMLGRIWGKEIKGVNNDCVVEKMGIGEVLPFLSQQKPSDILCLGERKGELSELLNKLENDFPENFNKQTVYASITERDGNVEPNKRSAIFTTYDSSKGLERPICVIFNFTEDYWRTRISAPTQSYQILRNIFCVAASRGKKRIIFVQGAREFLSEKTLSTEVASNSRFKNVPISSMFDFKYKENIEECYSLLKVKKITKNRQETIIKIKNKDGLIDLSPCIGIYQEAIYFDDYDIDKEIELSLKLNRGKQYLCPEELHNVDVEEKVLILTAIETAQDRYKTQVESPFISEMEKLEIIKRLSSKFKRSEQVQKSCTIDFSDKEKGKIKFSALGIADVLKNNVVYELKFVSELMHEHYLQCACYMIALGIKKGVLWNVKDGSQYQIMIPNRNAFLDAVARAITKNSLKKYYKPKEKFSWATLQL
ncbi:MAG: hypothetical protein E7380_00600 [Clostridiales bacterium]|nr:hypothetical protein [Clostridiales bacterium]